MRTIRAGDRECGVLLRGAGRGDRIDPVVHHQVAPRPRFPLDDEVLDLLHRFAGELRGHAAPPAQPARGAGGGVVASDLTYHLGRPLASWELVHGEHNAGFRATEGKVIALPGATMVFKALSATTSATRARFLLAGSVLPAQEDLITISKRS